MSPRQEVVRMELRGSVVDVLGWILLTILGEKDNDNAVGYGLFLLFIPVVLLVGAAVWWGVGTALRGGSPTLKPFMIRAALLVAGVVLLLKLWSLWGIWDAPPPVRYDEAIYMTIISALALGLSALPAAAAWWHLAIKPAAESA